jgi:hypothetical protein
MGCPAFCFAEFTQTFRPRNFGSGAFPLGTRMAGFDRRDPWEDRAFHITEIVPTLFQSVKILFVRPVNGTAKITIPQRLKIAYASICFALPIPVFALIAIVVFLEFPPAVVTAGLVPAIHGFPPAMARDVHRCRARSMPYAC